MKAACAAHFSRRAKPCPERQIVRGAGTVCRRFRRPHFAVTAGKESKAMDVDLIFKIAAHRHTCGRFEPAAHSLRAGGAGYDDDACGAHCGADDAHHADQHAVRYD